MGALCEVPVGEGGGVVEFLTFGPGVARGLRAGAQRELQVGDAWANRLKHAGQGISQGHDRCGHAQGSARAGLEPLLDGGQLPEEGLDELEEFDSSRQQLEGAATEEFHSQVRFELEQLSADGRLLDAVGHVAHRFHDASVPRHVVEQLQMVDIHPAKQPCRLSAGNDGFPGFRRLWDSLCGSVQ